MEVLTPRSWERRVPRPSARLGTSMNLPPDDRLVEDPWPVTFGEWARVGPLLERQRRGPGIPQAVVEAHLLGGVPLLRAWREHLG